MKKKPFIRVAGVDKKKGPKGAFLAGVAEEDVTIPAGASVLVFKNTLNPPPHFTVVWKASESGAPPSVGQRVARALGLPTDAADDFPF